jgi:hypothetical protein
MAVGLITCDCVNLPLIIAIQSGFTGQFLVDIAKHHEVNVPHLLDTLDSMVITDYPFYDRSGKAIPLSKLCIESIKAISLAFPEELGEALVSMKFPSVHLNLASLHSEDPSHWPSTRLSAYAKEMASGSNDVRPFIGGGYAMNDIKRDFEFDEYLPRDELGPRYDRYLERSGMLVPEAYTKKIHPLSLWEDMVQHAKIDNGNGLSGLFDYCVHVSPIRFRSTIAKALQCMTVSSEDFFKLSYWQYRFLEKKVKDTWLEKHVNTPRLLVNLISNDNFEEVLKKMYEQGYEYADHAIDFADRLKTPKVVNQWLSEIMATEPQNLSLSHFRIFHLDRYKLPEQTLSSRWRPEHVICHMLKGLELFVTKDAGKSQPKKEIDDDVLRGCAYIAKTLASRHELDYSAFAGCSSLSVRALAEAGLDKRRLPKMNNRDKGMLVLQEMGL